MAREGFGASGRFNKLEAIDNCCQCCNAGESLPLGLFTGTRCLLGVQLGIDIVLATPHAIALMPSHTFLVDSSVKSRAKEQILVPISFYNNVFAG